MFLILNQVILLEEYLRSGALVIDKPVGPSSHEVSAFVRKILGLKKAGHTGTLDQNVSGVLLVLLENSCKFSSFISKLDKEYVCVIEFHEQVSRKELDQAFSHFTGKIYQTPPLASAVARKLRVREIHYLNLIEVEDRFALFEVGCESGTYVRKLCTDIGEVLGIPAFMKELRRTRVGPFGEKEAITLHELSDAGWLASKGRDEALHSLILPIELVVEKCNYPLISLDEKQAKEFSNGAEVVIRSVPDDVSKKQVAVLNKNKLVGFAELRKHSEYYALAPLRIA